MHSFHRRRDGLLLSCSVIVTGFLLLASFVVTGVDGKQRQQQPQKSLHTHLTAKDYLVKGLEKIEPAFDSFDGRMYAGLVPTSLFGEDNNEDDDEKGELMFWLFCPDKPVYDDTLVIWLNGGPGCSSMGGCLFENGPVTIARSPAGFFGIDPQVPLGPNPWAWTNATMMMYVEQPHGTGFSTGRFPKDETDVGRDFYKFLQNLFTVFEQPSRGSSDEENGDHDTSDLDTSPDLRSKKLHFFGESYAGMYVPSIAHYIHKENRRGEYPHINLAGIGIGNGWIDARVQGPAVIDYAWWHGMIDSSTVRAMKTEWKNCKDGSSRQPPPFHRFTVPDECGIMGAVLEAAGKGVVDWGGPNAYDVTTWDPYTMLDAPEGSMNQFFNNPLVQDAMNVPRRTWIECMPGAGRRRRRLEEDAEGEEQDSHDKLLPGQILLAHDEPVSVLPYVADLLDDAKIRVLIYSGDRDMTTNAQGSEMLLDSMEWSGARGWADTKKFERGLWLPGSQQLGGYIKQYSNLEFLIVSNSGHLVPFNRDSVALDLITRFLGDESFLDKELPKFEISQKHVKDRSAGSSGPSASRIFTVLVVAVCSFVLGLLVSRRFPKTRGGYEMVQSASFS